MKAKASILFSVLLLLAVAYRFLWTLPSPMGAGRYAESRDKRFIAHASTLTSRSFFEGERDYYEFLIQDGERHMVRRLVIEPESGRFISWRDEGSIEWSEDQSTVTYSAPDFRLILKK